nr:hypothetical protein [Tanacetum cinerariifolium]
MWDTIAQTRFENVFKHSNDSLLARGNTLQSDEDRLKLDELMELCTNLQTRVIELETTQSNEIDSLKKRVKKLEWRNKSRTHKLKRLYKERGIDDIDADEDITLDDVQAKIDADHQSAKDYFRTELVQGQEKEKRVGEELIQKRAKKQKVEDDKETAELKQLMEIIPDKEEVAIDAIPLVVKSPGIVDWKIYKKGKKSYYQIIRADGKLKMYMFFSQMLTSFNMEDLKDLYKLVKAKYGSTRPVEDLDLLLWGDLKTMFKPHVEDAIWRKQQGTKFWNKSYMTHVEYIP